MMNATSSELHSILFADGRTLENFKFFPGDDKKLTPKQMQDAAAAALKEAFDNGLSDTPPSSGRKKSAL